MVDSDSDRFVDVRDNPGADRLFDDDGNPTKTAEDILSFGLAAFKETAQTQAFAAALKAANILMPGQVKIDIPGQPSQTMSGFMLVDEEAFRKLPDSSLREWFTNGLLDVITLQKVSQRNWQTIIKLYRQRTEKAGTSS